MIWQRETSQGYYYFTTTSFVGDQWWYLGAVMTFGRLSLSLPDTYFNMMVRECVQNQDNKIDGHDVDMCCCAPEKRESALPKCKALKVLALSQPTADLRFVPGS